MCKNKCCVAPALCEQYGCKYEDNWRENYGAGSNPVSVSILGQEVEGIVPLINCQEQKPPAGMRLSSVQMTDVFETPDGSRVEATLNYKTKYDSIAWDLVFAMEKLQDAPREQRVNFTKHYLEKVFGDEEADVIKDKLYLKTAQVLNIFVERRGVASDEELGARSVRFTNDCIEIFTQIKNK